MSDRDYLYGHVCRHGSLARSCQVCDLEDEVRQLQAERSAMLDVIEAAEVVSHENSPAELWDRLDAALARVRTLIGDEDA